MGSVKWWHSEICRYANKLGLKAPLSKYNELLSVISNYYTDVRLCFIFKYCDISELVKMSEPYSPILGITSYFYNHQRGYICTYEYNTNRSLKNFSPRWYGTGYKCSDEVNL